MLLVCIVLITGQNINIIIACRKTKQTERSSSSELSVTSRNTERWRDPKSDSAAWLSKVATSTKLLTLKLPLLSASEGKIADRISN